MKKCGIDLSMRSTGICITSNDKLSYYEVIKTSAKELNDEQLLIHISNTIISILKDNGFTSKDCINLEGLALGALSGEKDKIYGNFWNLRCELARCFPNTKLNIIPVTSWRNPLFSKEERKELKQSLQELKLLKKQTKELPKERRKENKEKIEQLEKKSSIKYQTFLKLSPDISDKFADYIKVANLPSDSIYDLTDAWFLSTF